MRVEVQSPKGATVRLTERSKMHYSDRSAFLQVLQDVRKNCELISGMPQDQLEPLLSYRKVLCKAHTPSR